MRSITVTNPERVIDPTTGLTKVALVRYYESIAERILPHLADRPVSLVRAPEGITGELFFQKHPETRMPGLRVLDAKLWPNHAALLSVDTADALVSAAQMNTIEFHTWNSTARKIDQPDRVIFDLDPGDGVTWAHVQEAALLMRAMLDELGLESWLKTSGGKGLHVVVPLVPKLGYDVSRRSRRRSSCTWRRRSPSASWPRAAARTASAGSSSTTSATATARRRRPRSRHARGPASASRCRSSWEQLMALKGGAQWTIATAREYLSFEAVDPWAGYWTKRQTLAAGMKKLA